MHYYFSANAKENSYIVLGDTSGSVIILTFNPTDRGPFKHNTIRDVTILRYIDIKVQRLSCYPKCMSDVPCWKKNKKYCDQGEQEGFNVTEFKNIHTNWVSQVAYYGNLRVFVSSSQCEDCSLCVCEMSGARTQYKFRVLMGISCFALCEGSLALTAAQSISSIL